MKPYEPVTDRLSTLNQLDQIRMSPGARRTAKACLRQAELLADMLMRVDAELRHAIGFAARGIAAFARRSRRPVARPQPN